uniref:C-type lectin domain-containing protein n=1 Tax=Gadus morhua TaxID=8049 RepID=A0A8C5A572_GADMO
PSLYLYVSVLLCLYVWLSLSLCLCSPYWKPFGRHCYAVYNGDEGYSWPEAQHLCQLGKAELVSVHSRAETLFLRQLNFTKHNVWIGLSRDSNSPLKFTGKCLSSTRPHLSRRGPCLTLNPTVEDQNLCLSPQTPPTSSCAQASPHEEAPGTGCSR